MAQARDGWADFFAEPLLRGGLASPYSAAVRSPRADSAWRAEPPSFQAWVRRRELR